MKKIEFTLTIKDPEPNRPSGMKINISRLAIQTGYSISHLSRVFTKKTTPSVKCLGELSLVLKMNIADLYDLIMKGVINVGN